MTYSHGEAKNWKVCKLFFYQKVISKFLSRASATWENFINFELRFIQPYPNLGLMEAFKARRLLLLWRLFHPLAPLEFININFFGWRRRNVTPSTTLLTACLYVSVESTINSHSYFPYHLRRGNAMSSEKESEPNRLLIYDETRETRQAKSFYDSIGWHCMTVCGVVRWGNNSNWHKL